MLPISCSLYIESCARTWGYVIEQESRYSYSNEEEISKQIMNKIIRC